MSHGTGAEVQDPRRSGVSGVEVDLLTAAAHELRTPITSIAGYATTLRLHRDRMSTAEVDQALEVLERQAGRLTATLDQLLDLARCGGRETPVAVELSDVVADALESAPPPVGVSVTVTVDPRGGPCVISSERLAMSRVLINLLTNAYNYGGANVAISSQNDTSEIVLSVEDDGPGVDADQVSILFTPFERGSTKGKSRPPGAGLGLALARTIVESFDGHLTYAAAHPHGACFTVVLPAMTAPTAAPAVSLDGRLTGGPLEVAAGSK